MEVYGNSFEPSPSSMRSELYAEKTIAVEGNIEMNGKNYYQRIFTDGCTELVRYNFKTKNWAILCFPNEDKTN